MVDDEGNSRRNTFSLGHITDQKAVTATLANTLSCSLQQIIQWHSVNDTAHTVSEGVSELVVAHCTRCKSVKGEQAILLQVGSSNWRGEDQSSGQRPPRTRWYLLIIKRVLSQAKKEKDRQGQIATKVEQHEKHDQPTALRSKHADNRVLQKPHKQFAAA